MSTDPSVQDSLGDEIKVFINGEEVGVALLANQLSNMLCLEHTSENDAFEFRNGGKNNVSTYFMQNNDQSTKPLSMNP